MIPIIDLRGDTIDVGRRIDTVCREVGFFQVVGHGVDDTVVDTAWRAARAFFDLPAARKQQVAPPYRGHPYGYLGLSDEALADSLGEGSMPDLKESFNVGPIDPPAEPVRDRDEALLRVATPWPDEPHGFRSALEAYWRAMDDLALRLMGAFAVGLGLDPQFFERRVDHGTSALRVLHYPDQATPPAPGQLRAGAHTDYGTLTILRQDDAPGGLEVLDPSGRWVPVPARPDAFVINVGDLMARWTNDHWRSTLHRVVNPPAGASARRQSIAFFHNANHHCVVECLATCCGPDDPARYPPVEAGRHLVDKFRRTR